MWLIVIMPVSTDAGDPFPGRDLILWITFCVILATLVFQGLTLPWLIRVLGVHDDGEEERREELKARITIAAAALDRIDELEGEPWVRPETLERMRGQYRYRKRRFAAQAGKIDDEDGIEDQSQGFQRASREVITAERRVLVALRPALPASADRAALTSIVREVVADERARLLAGAGPRSERELAEYKKSLRAEAEETKKLRREAWQAFRATHIVHLGEGVYWTDAQKQDKWDAPHAEERAAENELPPLDSPQQLAEALGLSISHLRWLSYHRDAATRIHYRRFTIPKRDGSERAAGRWWSSS